jgi:hypothetical protein
LNLLHLVKEEFHLSRRCFFLVSGLSGTVEHRGYPYAQIREVYLRALNRLGGCDERVSAPSPAHLYYPEYEFVP